MKVRNSSLCKAQIPNERMSHITFDSTAKADEIFTSLRESLLAV